MFDSNAIHCAAVFTTFDRVNAEMPTSLAEARDQVDAGRAATLAITGTSSASIVNAAVDAISDGRDPHEDPTLQRLAVDFALGQNSYGVLEALRAGPARAAVVAIGRQADVILARWREPFDAAAGQLTEADPETASHAARTVDQILAGWAGLHYLTGGSSHAAHMVFRYCALDYDTAIDGIQGRADVSPSALAKTGHAITFSTFDEFAARVTAFEAEFARRAASRVGYDRNGEPVG